jgi:hypothetical protein
VKIREWQRLWIRYERERATDDLQAAAPGPKADAWCVRIRLYVTTLKNIPGTMGKDFFAHDERVCCQPAEPEETI